MKTINKYNIAVLAGDGIGKEVTQATIPIFEALKLPIQLQFGDIGWDCWVKNGDPIPAKTWELVTQADATLIGAITSKPEREAHLELQAQNKEATYISPLIQLRKKLALFANVRPCFSIDKNKPFHFTVIRENTEGLYSGLDFTTLPEAIKPVVAQHPDWSAKMDDDISCSLRLQSKTSLQRIFKFAFEYAKENNVNKVTLADKPNVLRHSAIMSRDIFETQAALHPTIQADILNVDAVGMYMVKKPQKLGVIVAENMFGDILSDVGAGVMGGLGLAPSANIGLDHCYFEPVHGSGLKMQSKKANPSAMFLTISMMLSHLGLHHEAIKLKQAVLNVIQQNQTVTYDLKGSATTEEMANAIIQQAKTIT